MQCPNCGGEIPTGAQYCPYCNYFLKDASSRSKTSAGYPSGGKKRKPADRKIHNIISACVIVVLLIIVIIALIFGIKKAVLHYGEEKTTVPPVTVTVPETEESTAPKTETTGHFDEAKSHFFGAVDKLSSYLGDSASEFSVGEKAPDDTLYGSYSYVSRNNPDYIYEFTAEPTSDSSKLKAVCGKVKDLLPGRTNYTYNELFDILGDNMSAEKNESGDYDIIYKAEGCEVVFSGPFMGSLDAGLDEFKIVKDSSQSEKPEITETTKSEKEKIKDDPEKYFADNEKKSYKVVTDGDKLNMRSFAGTDNEIIGTIPNGDKVTVYGIYDGWAYAETEGGKKGWISENYIEQTD